MTAILSQRASEHLSQLKLVLSITGNTGVMGRLGRVHVNFQRSDFDNMR